MGKFSWKKIIRHNCSAPTAKLIRHSSAWKLETIEPDDTATKMDTFMLLQLKIKHVEVGNDSTKLLFFVLSIPAE